MGQKWEFCFSIISFFYQYSTVFSYGYFYSKVVFRSKFPLFDPQTTSHCAKTFWPIQSLLLSTVSIWVRWVLVFLTQLLSTGRRLLGVISCKWCQTWSTSNRRSLPPTISKKTWRQCLWKIYYCLQWRQYGRRCISKHYIQR